MARIGEALDLFPNRPRRIRRQLAGFSWLLTGFHLLLRQPAENILTHSRFFLRLAAGHNHRASSRRSPPDKLPPWRVVAFDQEEESAQEAPVGGQRQSQEKDSTNFPNHGFRPRMPPLGTTKGPADCAPSGTM